MLSTLLVLAASVLWLGLLFASALYAERRPQFLARHWSAVYALSLAVYCTSWTFYGTVTQAARYQWPLPPTFIGTILLYALGAVAMVRLVALSREAHASSIADLIATRLGKDVWLAAAVTLVAVLGLIPYIALQLKAVSMSYALLAHGAQAPGVRGAPVDVGADMGLYLTLALAVFSLLFGARSASAVEHNRGLVLAIAFESLFKLAAMLALGAYVWFGISASLPAPVAPPVVADRSGFAPLVLLGALAMFTLPHQFHIGVVECRDQRHVHTARWLFPLYLVLIALPLLPIAHAGQALLAGQGIPSDLYILGLPLAHGQHGLALFGFLGGLSAATGMIVVSTLTLSVMIGNHWIMPGLISSAWGRQGHDLRGRLLWLRRACIVTILLMAWAYSRLVAGNVALADVGATSFSALATLAPALMFAVWRPQTSPHAVTTGVIAGFAGWAWVMLPPLLAAPDWLLQGPFGQHWLSPDGFFGLTGWSGLARAVAAGLTLSLAATLAMEAWMPHARAGEGGAYDLRTLRNVGRRFLLPQRLDELLQDAPNNGPVPPAITADLERELAAMLGSASARLLLDTARRDTVDELNTVAAIVGEASQDLRFNQRILGAALENITQCISVVDHRLRLVAWNWRYAELFKYPPELLQIGTPVQKLLQYNLESGLLGTVDVEAEIARRLRHMRAGTPYRSERWFPGGAVVEIRGNPMPGGGFVATFTDVSAFRLAEAELRRSNETLEMRVTERTASLDQARHEAERANEAKSRFLAAVGHDLLQPLHAAHLFADALAEEMGPGAQSGPVAQLRGALNSTADLLMGLLDMSRLEAGGLVPEPRLFPLSEVLDPLASEFRALANARGLRLRYVRCSAWTHTDPQLLRRVLQNFLANAVRYTDHGSVLLGVRRTRKGLRVEVHDTGPGIPEHVQTHIFEEFRRGEGARGQGLGLGLAIADRIAGLLHAPLSLRSKLAAGTVFALQIGNSRPPAQQTSRAATPAQRLPARVLVVDNDPMALHALRLILQSWGHQVDGATDEAGAVRALDAHEADLWIFDFHLDDGDNGVDLHARLRQRYESRPTLIVSADPSVGMRRAIQESGLSLLTKPVKPLALKSVLDRLLAARVYRSSAS